MVWYSHPFQNLPQFIVIHTVKGFGIVNKAEIDAFLELSCFIHDPADVGNLISGSSAFSKTSLNIRKFMVHILLKPGLENFEHYLTSMWDEYNCALVWAFFGIALLWDWNENWPFPVLWPLLSLYEISINWFTELCLYIHIYDICHLITSRVIIKSPGFAPQQVVVLSSSDNDLRALFLYKCHWKITMI